MRITILILFCFFTPIVNGQNVYRSAESKSGILVGTQNPNSFAGISYENSSDKFSLDYKILKQKEPDNKEIIDFPDFNSWNFEFALETEKNKAALFSEEKWQGGIEFAVTRSWTKDKQELGLKIIDTVKTIYYTGNKKPGVTYNSIEECSNDTNTKCDTGIKEEINYEPKEKAQRTFFLTLGNDWSRFNNLILNQINSDTIFATLNNPGKNKIYLNSGVNWLRQFGSNLYLSTAISANIFFIYNSTNGLKKTNIENLSAYYYNLKDTTQLISTGKEKTYYISAAKSEILIIPRADLFLRYDLGGKKPLIGFVVAFSPFLSSTVNLKINLAWGIGVSPSSIPDQLVFAILNEWLEDDKGKLNYVLTFRASFPISFQ